MKKFFITSQGSIGINTETEEVFTLDTQREGIRSIYLAEEPMTVIAKKGDVEQEFTVKKDDIIVVFYDSDFVNKVAIVKSKDWVKNLKEYNKMMQKAKEEWAKKNSANNLGECNVCENCESCK